MFVYFFFKKKSALCLLIRSCSFINFWKKFHPVRLLDPGHLFISEKFLLCAIIFWKKSIWHFCFSQVQGTSKKGSIFKGQLYLLWSNCTIAMIPLMKITSYWHYCTFSILCTYHLFNPVQLLNPVRLLNPVCLLSFMKNSALCVY